MLEIIVLGPKKIVKAELFKTFAKITLPASVAAIPGLDIGKAFVKVHAVKDPVKRAPYERSLLVTMSGMTRSRRPRAKVRQLLAGIVLYELVTFLEQSGRKFGSIRVESVGGAFWVDPPRANLETLVKMRDTLTPHLQLLEEQIEILDATPRKADDDERLDGLKKSMEAAQALSEQVCGAIRMHTSSKL